MLICMIGLSAESGARQFQCETVDLATALSSTYSQGNIRKFWRDQRCGGKSSVLVHESGNISETHKN